MKTRFHFSTFLITLSLTLVMFLAGFAFVKQQDKGFIIDHEKDVMTEQDGSHNGGGKTTAFLFFEKFKNAKMTFRKRILHSGSSIGYHLQEQQEIYYILNGNGILRMNGKDITVSTGDAILTLPGSSHGLKPAGNQDLSVLITYQN